MKLTNKNGGAQSRTAMEEEEEERERAQKVCPRREKVKTKKGGKKV